MHRRFVPAVVALCLTVASSSAAFAQPSDPANPAESVGTARTTVDLGSVSLGDVRSGAIATVTSFASTDDDPARNDLGDGVPFALAGVQLPGGTELTATSDGASPVPGRSVELPAGLGAVRTGGLTAEVADGTARSLVETLDARLTPLGLTAATPEAGSTARVDAATATTTDGLVVENLSLGVGDLLGDDLLAALPLDVLLRLTDDLGLDLADLDLDAVVAQLEAIVDGIDDVEAVQAEIDDAQAAVTEAAAAVEEADAAVDAAQTVFETAAAALRDAEADLADAEDDLAEAQALLDACLAACDALEATVDGLTAEVVAARDDVAQRTAAVADADTALDAAAGVLADARAALDDAQNLVADLVAQLNDLIDQLQSLVDDLVATVPDLNAVVDGLVDGLDGFELLRVDQLTVGVRTVAGAKGSAGEALCAAQGVRVAGTAVPVETCDDLAAALADADAAIADVLAALPSDLPTGRIDDLVDVTAPATRVSDTNTRADDGTYVAKARVSGLGLSIAPLDLTAVAEDLLTADLAALVDGALADLEGLSGVDTAALAHLTGALEALEAQLAALPLPDFEELATPPVEVEPPVVAATSLFRTQGGSPRPVEVPDGTPAVNPGTPGVEVPGNGGPVPGSVVSPGGGLPADPAVPAGGPELPHTGGGASLAALLLLGVGAFAIRWLRAERDADATVGVR